MSVFKKRGKLAAGVLLFFALTGCGGGGGGGGGGSTVATDTIKWQPDTAGMAQFRTNDSQWYGYGFWNYLSESYQPQMTTVTATVEKMSGAPNCGYGIVFCYQDSNNFYNLLIDVIGHYTVRAKVAGTYTILIPWTAPTNAVIYKGFGIANEISVTQATPNNFQILFNGTVETQFTNSNFVGGKSGFYMGISSSAESFPSTPEDARFRMTAPIVYPTAAAAKKMLTPGPTAEMESGTSFDDISKEYSY